MLLMGVSSQMTQRFFVLKNPEPQEPSQYFEGFPIYGRGTDEYRYGNAWWADNMEYDAHFEPVQEKHRVRRLHRGRLSVVLPSPAAVGDFVWSVFYECLITDRVRRLFLEKGFSGYTTEPVAVAKFKRKSKRVSEIPQLFEMLIYGEGGPPDPSSGSARLTDPDERGFVIYSSYKNGLLVNERTWDGSDFFTIEGHHHIIVSERVKDLIVRERLSNCMLIPVENLIWPSCIETPEDTLQRKQVDAKRKAMGLETSTERAMREIEELRKQGITGSYPRERSRARKD